MLATATTPPPEALLGATKPAPQSISSSPPQPQASEDNSSPKIEVDDVKILPLTVESLNYHNMINTSKSSPQIALSPLHASGNTPILHTNLLYKLNSMQIFCAVFLGFVVGLVYRCVVTEVRSEATVHRFIASLISPRSPAPR